MTWGEASKFTWEEMSSLTWYQASLDKSKLLEQLSNGEIVLSDSASKKLIELCGEIVTQYNSSVDEKIKFESPKEKLSLKDKIIIFQMLFNVFDKAIQNEVLMNVLKNALKQFVEFLQNLNN